MFLKKYLQKEGFFVYPFDTNLIVNKNGEILDIRDKFKVKTLIDKKSNRYKIIWKSEDGKKLCYGYKGVIVLRTFVVPPDSKKYLVNYKNGNSLDNKLSNLEWIDYQEYQKKCFLNTRSYIKELFSLPDYCSDYNSYDYKATKECSHKPGYYYIPFTKKAIVVNKSGVFFDLEKNKQVSLFKDYKGYIKIHLGADASLAIWSCHRILGLLFLEKPSNLLDYSFDELEINHKDGNKNNNKIENLEWCTTNYNMIHAWESGLINTNKFVLARNLQSGEIIEFFSITQAANFLKRHVITLINHMDSISKTMVSFNGYQIKYKDDPTPWSELLVETDPKNPDSARSNAVFINKITHEIRIFSNINYGCSVLNLPKNIMKLNRQIKKFKKTYDGWILVSIHEYKNIPLEELLLW